VIGHYNLFRAAEINGSAAPGRSSGEAMAAMEELSLKHLPQGFGYESTGLSLEELGAGGAGQAGRRSVGTTVFGGMIASTLLNLYFIPILYLLIGDARERRGAKIRRLAAPSA
jgi:HAE1 family hydrophobic/amphiphilic exporter-1